MSDLPPVRLYVAGPYSSDNIIDCLRNIGRGEETCARLFAKGYAVYCPWHDADFVVRNWENAPDVAFMQRASMAWLQVSDAMLVLGGWQGSRGTLREMEEAGRLNIPIFHSEKELDEWRIRRMA